VRERVSHPVQLADSHEAVPRQGTQALVSYGSNYSRAYRYTLAPLVLKFLQTGNRKITVDIYATYGNVALNKWTRSRNRFQNSYWKQEPAALTNKGLQGPQERKYKDTFL
jgi:hypothetical protein